MPKTINRWPGIARACFLIALDNGGINRGRSDTQVEKEINEWLSRRVDELFPAIDAWLAALSDDELEIVCCGEESEMEAAMVDSPPFTHELLNAYFDEVC